MAVAKLFRLRGKRAGKESTLLSLSHEAFVFQLGDSQVTGELFRFLDCGKLPGFFLMMLLLRFSMDFFFGTLVDA